MTTSPPTVRAGSAPPLTARAAPRSVRWRAVAWRLRHVVAALALALAAAAAVRALGPAPPVTVPVLVAARDLPAGVTIGASDVRVAHVASAVRVAAALVDPADAVGAGTAVPVPAGLPLVPGLLVGTVVEGPPGTVVAAVRLSDDDVAALLVPGTHVDVLAATPETGEVGVVVARRALVLPVAAPPDQGGSVLGGATAADTQPVLLAVAPDEAPALAGAAASALLSVVVVP